VKCELGLRLEHLSKAWNGFALRDVSLDVTDGEYFALLGPNGAGKTLLLETVIGFHKPDAGRILLDSRDVTNVPPERRSIGYVPQNCMLFPHMRVRQNVEFGLKMRGVAKDDGQKAVHRVLMLMNLTSLAEKLPMRLSGGERQKVALARVLVTEPKVVLLDEPLTSIDAETSRNLREELRRINREFKVAFLHVTHDQIEAFSLADRIAIMREGKIVQAGTPNEVLSNPIDEPVARFLGYENVLHVRLVKHEGGISEVSADGIPIKLKGKLESEAATIVIRPEDLVITTEAPTVSVEWNSLEGKVREYTNLGPVVEVTIDAGLLLKISIDKRSFLELNLIEGKHVYVAFKVDSVRIVSLRQT
jgi:molybdate/tungstate transport system ATP-binding protein